nr:hypothetical protein [Tanacetum cinerariifolium]
EEDKAAWKAEYKKHNDVACLMLGKMSLALQKQFESYPPQLMLAELKKMFEKPQAGLKDKAPTPQVLTIQKGRENKPKPQANKKDKSKGKTYKNKKVVPYQPKPKHNPLKRKENPNKDQTCHHCHVAGH